MPFRRATPSRSVYPLAALVALAALAEPAWAGGRILVDRDTNTPIVAGPGADIEVLPSVDVTTALDAITANGTKNIITIGRGARVHSGNDGIQTDHARFISIRGRVTGGSSGIEIDGSGDRKTRVLIWSTGVVRGTGGTGAIDLDGDATVDLWNYGLIEGFRNPQINGIDDLRGRLSNYGRILANGDAVNAEDARIFNYGFIWGGRSGNDGAAINMKANSRLLELWNGPYGRLRSTFGPAIQISPGNNEGGLFRFQNWGLVESEQGPGLSANEPNVRLDIANYGILRGGLLDEDPQAAIRAERGVIRLTGTGLYAGGVRNDAVNERPAVILDGVNVPLSVKQELDGRRFSLGERQSLDLGPRLRIGGAIDVTTRDLWSFQDFTAPGLEDAGDAFDTAVIPRLGVDLKMIGLLGTQRDDPEALGATLETVTGRSVQHAVSDIAFHTETLLANKLNDYMDRRIDRAFWDAERAGPGGLSYDTPRIGAFVQGLGTFGEQDPTDGRVEQDWRNYGGVAGLDATFGERGFAGLMAAFRTTDADVDGFGSDFDSNDVSVGAYGSVGPCGCGFVGTGGLWYTYHDYDGTRAFQIDTPDFLPVDSFGSVSRWETDGHQLTTFGRASYNWRPEIDRATVISPFFTVQYSSLWVDGYRETGSPNLNLVVDDQQGDSLRTMLGVRLSREFDLGFARLRPEFRGEWIHESLDDGRDIDTRLESPFVRPFQVESDVDARDYGKIGVGAVGSMPGCDCLELSVNYDTILGRDELELHDVSANLRLRF
jgi:hypothetical protein